MIKGVFHQGSGLGNQLHRYVMTRVLALDKGYNWEMLYIPNDPTKEPGFKGKSFMKLETRISIDNTLPNFQMFNEKKWYAGDVDIRSYDPDINFVQDNTLIDGEFQDERYWEHREKEVNEWLKVEPLDVPDDICVIGFRGGEFSVYPNLFLPREYFDEGIRRMREINPNMKFEVHTDDRQLAKKFFPEFEVIQDIGLNWRSMRYAKYAIVANSSFFILPRWLNKGLTIAPRWWGRHNIGIWCMPQNYYKRFTYV